MAPISDTITLTHTPAEHQRVGFTQININKGYSVCVGEQA